jgi:dUTPase
MSASDDMVSERYPRWTEDLQSWLIPYAASVEVELRKRVRIIAKHMNLSTSGGRNVVQKMAKVLEMTDALLLRTYWENEATRPAMATDTARWSAVCAELKDLIPASGQQTGEERLLKMSKLKSEGLCEFISRYRTNAAAIMEQGGVLETRATRILFNKLPKKMQQHLSILDFSECKLANLEKRARNMVDWMAVSSPGVYQPEELHDYMDVDSVRVLMAGEKPLGETPDMVVAGVSHSGYLSFPVTLNSMREFWSLMEKLRANQAISKKITSIFARPPERHSKGWGHSGGATGRLGGRPYEPRSVRHVASEDKEMEDMLATIEDVDTGEATSSSQVQSFHGEDGSSSVPMGMVIEKATTPHTVGSGVGVSPLLHVDAHVQGEGSKQSHVLKLLVDSGAGVSVLSSQVATRLGLTPSGECKVLEGFNDALTRSLGSVQARVKIGKQVQQVSFQVIPQAHQNILGKRDIGVFGFMIDCGKNSLIHQTSGEVVRGAVNSVQPGCSTDSPQALHLKLAPQARLPAKKGGNGYEVRALAAFQLAPGEIKAVAVGVQQRLPGGTIGLVTSSGTHFQGVVCHPTAVHSTGEWTDVKVLLENVGQCAMHFKSGVHLANLAILRQVSPKTQVIALDSAPATERSLAAPPSFAQKKKN